MKQGCPSAVAALRSNTPGVCPVQGLHNLDLEHGVAAILAELEDGIGVAWQGQEVARENATGQQRASLSVGRTGPFESGSRRRREIVVDAAVAQIDRRTCDMKLRIVRPDDQANLGQFFHLRQVRIAIPDDGDLLRELVVCVAFIIGGADGKILHCCRAPHMIACCRRRQSAGCHVGSAPTAAGGRGTGCPTTHG